MSQPRAAIQQIAPRPVWVHDAPTLVPVAGTDAEPQLEWEDSELKSRGEWPAFIPKADRGADVEKGEPLDAVKPWGMVP